MNPVSESARIGMRGVKHLGVLPVAMTAFDFKTNLDQGQGVGTAAVKTAGTYFAWSAAAPMMWAHTAATTGLAVGEAAFTWRRQKAEEWHRLNRPDYSVGGNYIDTQGAQTMRQAAVQAIQGSKLNARSALGGEARIFHNNSPRQW